MTGNQLFDLESVVDTTAKPHAAPHRGALPVVSILMGVYNAADHLTEALDSLLAQTTRDFELVIVDDASSDTSPEILGAYAARDDRIRLVRNEANIGLAATLNRGLAHCRAPIIARADADDIYAPEYLEVQLRLMYDHPEVGVASSAFHKVDTHGRYLNTFYPPTEDRQIRSELLFTNCLSHPTTVFRAELVREAGGYDESFWAAQDYELWARLRDTTRFANSSVPLVRYRRHRTARSRTRGTAGLELSLSVSQRLLSRYLEHPLSIEDTRLLRNLYRCEMSPDPEAAHRGIRLLREILRRARLREEQQTLHELRHRIAGSLMNLAIETAELDRTASRVLLQHAARWNPRSVLRVRTLKLGARLHLPEPVVDFARWAIHGTPDMQ